MPPAADAVISTAVPSETPAARAALSKEEAVEPHVTHT